MTGLYWRAARPRPVALWLVALVAVCAVATTEVVQAVRVLPGYDEKVAAARLCNRAFDVLREERIKRRLPIDPELDPMRSGLIGALLTPITTEAGRLSAKQTSVNPNFAAVVVAMLQQAGVRRGEAVAMFMTGSFPALDVAVLAAVESMGLRPLLLVSAGSSQWGANEVGFTWPDMLSVLLAREVLSTRPLAASRGGVGDVARGMSEASQAALDEAIARLGVPRLAHRNLEDQVAQRLALLRQVSAGTPIKAFINVGGGTLSVGLHATHPTFRPGINHRLREGVPLLNSLAQRFLDDGVPVINMHHVEELARQYGLPRTPNALPIVGEGGVYRRTGYSRWVAAASLGGLLVAMVAIFRRREG